MLAFSFCGRGWSVILKNTSVHLRSTELCMLIVRLLLTHDTCVSMAMKGSCFLLCTIMHSNPDVHTFIYFRNEGQPSAPSCHQARLNVSWNVRLWEMAAHHVSICRDTLTGVFPTEQSLVLEPLCFLKQSQERISVLPHALLPNIGMRTKTEKEICVWKDVG